MSQLDQIKIDTIECLEKIAANGGKVYVSRGLNSIAALYGNKQGQVLFNEEAFDFAVSAGWLLAANRPSGQIDYLITPLGRTVAGFDVSELTSETIKCLVKLSENGGKVSVSKGLSSDAANYSASREPVLYGDEEFEFAVMKGWLTAQLRSQSQTDYTITAAGRQIL